MSIRVTYAFMSSVVIVESAICGVRFVASAVKLETEIIIDVLGLCWAIVMIRTGARC